MYSIRFWNSFCPFSCPKFLVTPHIHPGGILTLHTFRNQRIQYIIILKYLLRDFHWRHSSRSTCRTDVQCCFFFLSNTTEYSLTFQPHTHSNIKNRHTNWNVAKQAIYQNKNEWRITIQLLIICWLCDIVWMTWRMGYSALWSTNTRVCYFSTLPHYHSNRKICCICDCIWPALSI